jgi:hypothetical protein
MKGKEKVVSSWHHRHHHRCRFAQSRRFSGFFSALGVVFFYNFLCPSLLFSFFCSLHYFYPPLFFFSFCFSLGLAGWRSRQLPIVLVGNKADLISDREVSQDEGRALATSIHATFEASAFSCPSSSCSLVSGFFFAAADTWRHRPKRTG